MKISEEAKKFAQSLYDFYISSGQKERAEEFLKARPKHIQVETPGIPVKKEDKKDGKSTA